MFAAACPTCSVGELVAGLFARSIVLLAAVWTPAWLAVAALSGSSWALTLPSASVFLPCKAVRLDLAVFPLEAGEGADEVAFAVEAVDVLFLGWVFIAVGLALRRVLLFDSVGTFSTTVFEKHPRCEG